MAISDNWRDNEAESFVECPDGSGKAARRVCVANGPNDPIPTEDKGLAQLPKATIKNVANSATKESFIFETGCKRFSFRCEKVITILYNFSEVDFDAGKKLTITSGGLLKESGLNLPAGTTIFFETSSNNRDIEILQWV